MHYTWDEEKNRRNLEVHGIAFDDAARIFEGPTIERVAVLTTANGEYMPSEWCTDWRLPSSIPTAKTKRDASFRRGVQNRRSVAITGTT